MSQTPSSRRPPDTGVVIVNYNGGHYLRRCLESVLKSDPLLAVVVVDNDSTDASIESIRGIETAGHQLSVVSNSQNLGFSRGVNIGRRRLDCRYLLVLNPDCVIYPHTVSRLVHTLNEEANAGLVGPLVFNEDGSEQRGCRRNEPTLGRSVATALGFTERYEGVDQTGQPLPRSPVAVDAVSGACMLMAVDLFDELGGMDESYFLHCEDLDLCRRVRDSGYLVVFDPTVSVFHRQGGSSGAGFSRIEKLKHQSMLRYYRQHHIGSGAQHPLLEMWLMKLLVWGHFIMAFSLHQVNRLRDIRRPAVDAPALPLPVEAASLVVTGANSDVGDSLLQQLCELGRPCIAITRQRPHRKAGHAHVRWLTADYFDQVPDDDLPALKVWVQLAPIWTTGRFESMAKRCGVIRMIGLSSTSIVAKSASENPGEAGVVKLLGNGEDTFTSMAEQYGATGAILRPTLIYGGARNRNINLVKTVIRLTRRFFIVGDGEGRRQPVHADDVAMACLSLLDHYDVEGVFDLPGAETLTYRQMVERVFESVGRRVRIVTIAPRLAEIMLGVVGRIPGLGMFTPEMAHRMSRDQVFSCDRATTEFDYRPGPFRP